MKVKILGETGFIGSNVLTTLKRKFEIVNSEICDVLVNCAGFSRMYEGSKNPDKMREFENSIFHKIKKHKFKYLIHLSTTYIDVYPDDIYSQIKKDMEDKILNIFHNVTILRLGGVIGKGLKKNVVFDLVSNKKLFVTAGSVYNYISAEEVGNIITHLISNQMNGIINVGASESISAKGIAVLLGKNNPEWGEKREDIYIDTTKLQRFYNIKTSTDYIKDFRNSLYDEQHKSLKISSSSLFREITPYYKGNWILDVGSNTGSFIESCLDVFPTAKLMGFEPVKKYFNYSINKFKDNKNVVFHNYGLSDVDETVDIFVAQNNIGWNTIIREMVDADNSNEKEATRCINFDNFIKTMPSNFVVDLVKIDTEGYEYKVLNGMREFLKNQKPVILCEIGWGKNHPYWTKELDAFDYLYSIGYERTNEDMIKNLNGTTDIIFKPK